MTAVRLIVAAVNGMGDGSFHDRLRRLSLVATPRRAWNACSLRSKPPMDGRGSV
jgi:hypothetical protein